MGRIITLYNRAVAVTGILMFAGAISARSATCTSVKSGSWNSNGTWIKALTGSISTTFGNATVNGSGTSFLTELSIGDTIMLQSAPTVVIGRVMLITGNTSLMLSAVASASVSGPFGARKAPSSSSDAVVIRSGDTITLGANAVSGSVTINNSASGTGSSALVLNGHTLTITGLLRLNTASSGTTSTLVDVGSGTLTTDSLLIDAGAGSTRASECRIGSGTLTVNGDVAFSGTASKARLTYTGAGTASIGGDLGAGGTFTTVAGATTEFDGAAGQSVGPYGYATLVIAKPSGVATLAGNAGITGDLTISQGELDLDTFACDRSTPGGTLTIGNGGTLTIDGTGTLPAGFTTISLAPLSTVEYAGADQSIAAATYGNLTIDGSGTKALAGDVIVGDTLAMHAGDMQTGAYDLTIGSSIFSLGAVAHISGTIFGCIHRWVAPLLATNILFPVGVSGHYAGLDLSFTVAPVLGGTITVCFEPSNPGTTGLPLVDGSKTIANVAQEGYWEVAAAEGLTGGVYSIDLSATAFGGVQDPTTLDVLYRPDASASWSTTGTASPGSGTLLAPVARRLGISTYGEFGVGGGGDNVLPVEMAEFDGDWGGSGVRLAWRTASEVNNAGFVLSRADRPEGPYEQIASYLTDTELRGLGTTPIGARYAYIDHDGLRPGARYYYGLRQVDVDGEFHDIPTKVEVLVAPALAGQELGVASISKQILTWPCPSIGPVTIGFLSRVSGSGTLSLYDRLGCLVDRRAIDVQAGENAVPADLGALPPGAYDARVEVGAQSGFGSVLIAR